jgi:hypothetical protein
MALPAVPLATAAQICTALHAAHEQWNACAIGQPITVAWRQQLPRSGPVKNHRRQLW